MMANTYILGIESSCDETSAAVVRSGEQVISNVVLSQIATHQPYGGVVIDPPSLVKAREPRISGKFWFLGTLRESTRYPGITHPQGDGKCPQYRDIRLLSAPRA